MVIKSLLLCTFTMLGIAAVNAQEELELIIDESRVEAEDIAVVPFGWSGIPPPADIAKVVAGDLARTGEFRPIPREDLPSLPTEASKVVFRDWHLLGAPSLVIGNVSLSANGKYVVRYRLFDVFKAKQALGWQF